MTKISRATVLINYKYVFNALILYHWGVARIFNNKITKICNCFKFVSKQNSITFYCTPFSKRDFATASSIT